MYDVFVKQCVIRPQFIYLERAYNDYRTDSRPCKRGATNQCAVRMSIALARAGFGLESFQPPSRVHDGDGACRTGGIAHVLGAQELARFLRRTMFEPRVSFASGGSGCANTFQQIRCLRGILYFNNCFTREGENTAQGDHIDLFNGERYFNEIIHPRAGGDETRGGRLFERADQVWFWRLA
jgi:type VI secretion system (T6SS) effector Tae4 (amidase)